jgi:hypothetical protein
MANLGTEFDASQVEPSAPLEPVPPGEYVAQIKNSEMKPTKKGDGQYLQLDIEITEGDFKCRKFFDRLNLDNPNETAAEIAHRTLSAICHAVGVLKVKDSSQLHYKRMLVRVDVEKRDGYAAQNVVKSYKPLEGASGETTTAASSSEAPAVKKPSWSR